MAWSEDPKLKLLQFQVPEELLSKIDELAVKDKRSRSKECEYLLELGIENRQTQMAHLDNLTIEKVRQALKGIQNKPGDKTG